MVSLQALIDLHASFDNHFGIGDNLIHYLAQPPHDHNGINFEVIKLGFVNRQNNNVLTEFKIAPQDVMIFQKRFSLLANDNEAYRIALSTSPSVEELIAFSYIQHGWSVLFPVKQYLMHHPDKAKDYTGFQPYGGPVIAFVNSLESKLRDIPASPSYADHSYLQQITNREARVWGMPSVEINNVMYLRGKKLIKGKKEVLKEISASESVGLKEWDKNRREV
jgi:hypothetical protein